MRAKFQGVRNVVAFNWPYYALAGVVGLGLVGCARLVESPLSFLLLAGAGLTLIPTLSSVLVSLWVHDLSGLYELPWLAQVNPEHIEGVVVFNAGFDEISETLKERFSDASVQVFDFYDPATQTAASIRRARKRQTGLACTVGANPLPVEDGEIDLAVAFMSAHEIRETDERVALFRDIRRCLSPKGTVIVVEHVRDLANFVAYNIGFLHFLPLREWHATFRAAGFEIQREVKHTPFVTTFVLRQMDPSDEEAEKTGPRVIG